MHSDSSGWRMVTGTANAHRSFAQWKVITIGINCVLRTNTHMWVHSLCWPCSSSRQCVFLPPSMDLPLLDICHREKPTKGFTMVGEYRDCGHSSWLGATPSAVACAEKCKLSEPNAQRFVWVPRGDKNCKCASATCSVKSDNYWHKMCDTYEYKWLVIDQNKGGKCPGSSISFRRYAVIN